MISQSLAFEDFQPGHFRTIGPRTVTRDEIVAFAREYDPQPMHLDEEAAKKSMLGGLAASGWHMAAIQMRMVADGLLNGSTGLGAPGIDELRWQSPLRPGSTVFVEIHVLESRASKSKPDIGIVKFRFELRDEGGTVLMTQTLSILFRRRAALAE